MSRPMPSTIVAAICMGMDTDAPSESHREESCVVPRRLNAAFAVLQEKWALAVVYVLLKGPQGFNEIARAAGSVNPATLTHRLARMEQVGLVTKTVQSVMPPRTLYQLTDAGDALRPVIRAFETWVHRHPLPGDAD